MSAVVIVANGKAVKVNPLLHPDRLCHGQQCYLRIPGICRNDPATMVPAHSNQLKDGKGTWLIGLPRTARSLVRHWTSLRGKPLQTMSA